jgi:alkylation response protein AidB-like acyl-CoA dehydrogenase
VDFRDTAEEAAYRHDLATWLAAFQHDHEREPIGLRTWQRALHEAGYLAQTWSVEEGGRGLSPVYDVILNEEVARAAALPIPPNLNFLARAIFRFGNEVQKERFLLATLRGDIQWCQGFSEPEAGSDLAAMRTQATPDGDGWVIRGQKLWTSGSEEADWCFLLARSEPGAPKHDGISVFLVDMRSPGVTARGVRTSDGEVHTGETFWDDVRVPAENLLGVRGGGWRIAMWMLQFERGPADIGVVPAMRASLRELRLHLVDRGEDPGPSGRRAMARAEVAVQVLHLQSVRQVSLRAAGRPEGPEGPVAKLLWAQAAQAVGHAWLDATGGGAMTSGDRSRALEEYFASRHASIYGGTSEIQRNVLAQRHLGMPRLTGGHGD